MCAIFFSLVCIAWGWSITNKTRNDENERQAMRCTEHYCTKEHSIIMQFLKCIYAACFPFARYCHCNGEHEATTLRFDHVPKNNLLFFPLPSNLFVICWCSLRFYMSFKFQWPQHLCKLNKVFWLHFRCRWFGFHLLRYFHNFSHFYQLIFINFDLLFHQWPSSFIIFCLTFLATVNRTQVHRCQRNISFWDSLIYFHFVWHLFGFANSVNRLREERVFFWMFHNKQQFLWLWAAACID